MPSSPAESKLKKTATAPKTSNVPTTAKKAVAKAVKSPSKAGDEKTTASTKAVVKKPKEQSDEVRLEESVSVALSDEKMRQQEELKKEAEVQMEKLRKAAWQVQVEYDRKQEEKMRKKAEEESKRKKEEAFITKALLEAAFDGDDEEIDKLLRKASSIFVGKSAVEASDGHGNTLISEAAAGGSSSTVTKLIALGADPNSKGEFGRTPLWRASFLGKSEVIRPLLEGGGDPRLMNESGELPVHVASDPSIKVLLESWDLSRTDLLVGEFLQKREQKFAQEAAEKLAALNSAESALVLAQKTYDSAQQTLLYARGELEKRITEYDTCVEEKRSAEIVASTLASIKEAERLVEEKKAASSLAFEALDAARFTAREKKLESDSPQSLPGIPLAIKDLDSVLLRDLGGKLSGDGRWPLVIDVSGQASVFLRYIDSNYISALLMEPEKVRRSLLGAIRYGKPFVLDMMDIDLWHQLPSLFDNVSPGLFGSILTKQIVQEQTYRKLIKESDGEAYDITNFQTDRIEKGFKFILLTSASDPSPGATEKLCAFRVSLKAC